MNREYQMPDDLNDVIVEQADNLLAQRTTQPTQCFKVWFANSQESGSDPALCDTEEDAEALADIYRSKGFEAIVELII